MTIVVDAPGIRLPFTRRELRARLEMMLERSGIAPDFAGIELVCVRDARMLHLNGVSMHCPGPTNILAFPADEHARGALFLGSLALSLDTMHREARLYGQDAPTYCLRLLAHGLAHLLGYDHGPDMERACAQMLAMPEG